MCGGGGEGEVLVDVWGRGGGGQMLVDVGQVLCCAVKHVLCFVQSRDHPLPFSSSLLPSLPPSLVPQQ